VGHVEELRWRRAGRGDHAGGAALDGDSAITLDVDGVRVQSGHLGAMIWGEAELVAELSRWQALQPGDLIFTGTPAGVGAVGVGARLVGQVDGLEPVVVTIGDGDRSVPDNALSYTTAGNRVCLRVSGPGMFVGHAFAVPDMERD
jgi:hypothetical protein